MEHGLGSLRCAFSHKEHAITHCSSFRALPKSQNEKVPRSHGSVRGIKADARFLRPALVLAKQPMPSGPSKPASQQCCEMQRRIGPVVHAALVPNPSDSPCQPPSPNSTTVSTVGERRLLRDRARGAVFDVSTQAGLMMETITIPSPSVFLSSPVVQAAKLPPPTSATPQKRKAAAARLSPAASKESAGLNKPKQSKSRNGGSSAHKFSYRPLSWHSDILKLFNTD